MSDSNVHSDDTSGAMPMEVDTQSNVAANTQSSATEAASNAADQITETEMGQDSQSSRPLRKEAELNRKQRSLAEFLSMMDNYTPAVSITASFCPYTLGKPNHFLQQIPDAVTDYYLSRTGFDCDDVRMFVYSYNNYQYAVWKITY